MNYADLKIVILGAAGNIGSAIVHQLAMAGPDLVLIDRRHSQLIELKQSLLGMPAAITVLPGDLGTEAPRLAQETLRILGGVDILINCTGQEGFHMAASESPADTARLFASNTIGPIQFTNSILPTMLDTGFGHIANVGSILGSLAFPCFATYSASKSALRAYSEALRRELAGTGIHVHYIATRYIRTPSNPPPLACLANLMKLPHDYPTEAAWRILDAIEHQRTNTYPGWSEKFYVWLNTLAPAIIDHLLRPVTSRIQPLTQTPIVHAQVKALEKL